MAEQTTPVYRPFYRPSRQVRVDLAEAERRVAELRAALAFAEGQESTWAEEEYL